MNFDLAIHGIEAAAILWAVFGGLMRRLSSADKIEPLEAIVRKWDAILLDYPPHRHVNGHRMYPNGLTPEDGEGESH